MLYLDQTRNRKLFMAGSIIATVVLVAVLVPGINAVGVIMAAAIMNILVYYAMPDSYSPAFMVEHGRRDYSASVHDQRR